MPTYRSSRGRVAITIGDPAGIGPEITIKALTLMPRSLGRIIVVGDLSVVKKQLSRYASRYPINHCGDESSRLRGNHINFVDTRTLTRPVIKIGAISKKSAQASIRYIDRAVELIKHRRADALVTAPINKEAVHRVGFSFPGHTEYLAHLSSVKSFAMMLVAEPLRITPVTRHIPLKEVPESLSKKKIIEASRLTLQALTERFGIRRPTIAIAGLNPHAGEAGVMGSEEGLIIRPAVTYLRRTGADVRGPIPADAVFYDALKGRYDAVICMYHDQGLIPLKMIARDRGVNTTLGLPYIRTSPDHGTAFDIAGRGIADPSSMIAAIRLALSLSTPC